MDEDDMMGGGQWRKRPFQDDDMYGMGGYPSDPSYRGMEPPSSNYRKQDPYQNYNQSYTGGYNEQGGGVAQESEMGGNSWSSFFDEAGSFNPDGSPPKPIPPKPIKQQSQGYGGQSMYSQGYDFSQDVPIEKDYNQWSRGGGGGAKRSKPNRGGGRGGRGGGGGQSAKPWGQGPSPWSSGGSSWDGPSSWEDTSSWQDMGYSSYPPKSENQRGGGFKRGGRGGSDRGRGGGDRGRGGGDRGRGQSRGGGRGRGSFDRGQSRGGQRGGRGRGNQGIQQNKPGMPPNQIGGFVKKRGGMKQTSVPPVHSMANVARLDVSQMSTAEKIRRFCLFLQTDVSKVNAIQTIENGITGSKLGLKTEYKCEELMKVANKWMYTGCLHLSGVFLARSVGGNKKEVKHDTYSKGLDILKLKTVAEIYSGIDPGPDAIRNELSSSLDKDMDISKQASNALQKQELIATTLATKEEGFVKLVHYLKTYEKLPESKIGAIEQAVTASKCGMDHKYEDRQARLPTGKMIFRGTLTIEGIVIAHSTGPKRKETKAATYAMAYESFSDKPIHEILRGIPDEEDFINSEKALFSSPDVKKNMTLEEKLTALMGIVKDTQFQENNINTIDCSALHLGLTPTCIYRKSVEDGSTGNLICELYLDNVLIGTGESERRKESQMEAYNSAYDTLSTSTSDYILREHKRLKPEDTNDPNIVDVWVKGEGKHNIDSNMAGLKRYRHNPDDAKKTVETFVILEHDDWAMDRKRQAFCILNYSATLNGMLLQWNIEADGSLFKCEIKLQGQHIGEAYGPSKGTVRNLAAADALFRLYETQSVVKILRRDDSKLWIAYENIASKADAVKQASGEEEVKPEEPPKEVKEGEPIPLAPPNKWVMKIVEEILNTFNNNFTLDELIFGPGMPVPEKKAVTDLAKLLDLKVSTRQRDGQGYIVIHKSRTPQEMVKCLSQHQGTSGRYSLIPAANLPKHSDIEEEIRRTTPNATVANPKPIIQTKKRVSHIKGQQAQSIMMKLAGVAEASMETLQFKQEPSFDQPKINWL